MKILLCRLQVGFALALVMLLSLPMTAQTQQPLPSPDPATADKNTPQTNPSSPDNTSGQSTQPLGTAAAPYENPSGVAASRPAGEVIAPAKQRRKHSFLIKVGLIIGGAAAIGTIVALSSSSPSRPN